MAAIASSVVLIAFGVGVPCAAVAKLCMNRGSVGACDWVTAAHVFVMLTTFVMIVVAARLQTPGFFQKYCQPHQTRVCCGVFGRMFVSLCGLGVVAGTAS